MEIRLQVVKAEVSVSGTKTWVGCIHLQVLFVNHKLVDFVQSTRENILKIYNVDFQCFQSKKEITSSTEEIGHWSALLSTEKLT